MPARLSLSLVACASVLALSACKDDNAAPAAYDFASAPPAVIDLNAPATYADYAPAERAYAFDRATYRRPPSYGFRYGDGEPWAWRTADDYSMYAEPYDDGYRNYYYAPGGDYPYFVRDDDYGYGYGPDGALVAVYDSGGMLLPQDRLAALATLAGAYLVRASAIRRYGLDDSYRIPVTEDDWFVRAPSYYEVQQDWYAAPDRQPRWRTWRASHETEVAQFLPRGPVLRWNKDDQKAWKAYEKADRKAWQAEDKAWRKTERRGDRQVAMAAPPAAPQVLHEDRQDRGDRGRKAWPGGPPHESRAEAPRDEPRGRGRPERVELATADPRPAKAAQREAAKGPRAEQPERAHGGGRREARIDTPQPAPANAAPPREHGGNRKAEGRREVAAAQPQPQAQPQPAAAAHEKGPADHGPDRAAKGADQGGHGQGGGKPDGAGHGKGGGKDK